MDECIHENWVEVIGHEDYDISDSGRLRSRRRWERGDERVITPNYVGKDRQYPQVQLYSGDGRPRFVYLSRLVAQHFMPGYNGERLQYIDGNPRNVDIHNLYFISDGWLRSKLGSVKIHTINDIRELQNAEVNF